MAGWRGCCGRETFAGSVGPGRIVTGREGRRVVRRLSRARAGFAS